MDRGEAGAGPVDINFHRASSDFRKCGEVVRHHGSDSGEDSGRRGDQAGEKRGGAAIALARLEGLLLVLLY